MTHRHAPVRSWWWSEQLLCLNSRNGDVDSYVEHLVTEPADNFLCDHDHDDGHCDACLPIVQRFCRRESRSSIIALNSAVQCNDAIALPLHFTALHSSSRPRGVWSSYWFPGRPLLRSSSNTFATAWPHHPTHQHHSASQGGLQYEKVTTKYHGNYVFLDQKWSLKTKIDEFSQNT